MLTFFNFSFYSLDLSIKPDTFSISPEESFLRLTTNTITKAIIIAPTIGKIITKSKVTPFNLPSSSFEFFSE